MTASHAEMDMGGTLSADNFLVRFGAGFQLAQTVAELNEARSTANKDMLTKLGQLSISLNGLSEELLRQSIGKADYERLLEESLSANISHVNEIELYEEVIDQQRDIEADYRGKMVRINAVDDGMRIIEPDYSGETIFGRPRSHVTGSISRVHLAANRLYLNPPRLSPRSWNIYQYAVPVINSNDGTPLINIAL